MRRLAFSALPIFIITLLGLVALPSGRGLIDRVLFPDEATLDEGLAATIAAMEDTAIVAEGAAHDELAFNADDGRDAAENADPTLVGELDNNYSLADHSNDLLHPGLEDCDRWSNAFDDGWSATYTLTARTGDLGADERRQVFDAVRRFWTSEGYTVNPAMSGDEDLTGAFLVAETDYGRLTLWDDDRRGTISMRGTTNCLPPG